MKQNPIICAIDCKNTNEAIKLITQIKPYIGAVKLGLEFFTYNGKVGVSEIAKLNIPIFLDLKFHDIPHTVAGAIESVASISDNIFLTTIHTSGGLKMMKSAVKATSKNIKIIGVTMLTSLSNTEILEIGFVDNAKNQVQRLAKLANDAGLDGAVCSPWEISDIRKICGDYFTIIVPGIRLEGNAADDQARVMTPSKALKEGANYLVIGRPITNSSNPAMTAKKIFESI